MGGAETKPVIVRPAKHVKIATLFCGARRAWRWRTMSAAGVLS
jgi:hypothetical protein